ncbi:uncharacterized protein EI97DRAFT_377774 [Westerdykella ornata]|uniref:Transcription factor hoxa13 n=1 Tax=Westerdykella ornata TaxID=318751 RepID=A0A6A6JJJ2_WESOR|nr:uncharacterized protein EI97DRAFT_377774 [Westerdykella ornata]KAF2276303.1 hypothetical protein EI97DRAFT_377774 [Westerdykella ornata]
MAAQSNGRAKKPTKTFANGHTNGSLNGAVKTSKLNRPVTLSPSQRKPRRTFSGIITNIALRLGVWYLIITCVFRCPSSLTKLSESSPAICKPYLHARAYVTPYVDPYYQAYVAPQAARIQPYWASFDQKVYTPVASFAKDTYAVHGAHRVERARHHLEVQWEKAVQPQIKHLKDSAKGQYDLHVGPHVNKVTDTVMPFYEQTRDSTSEIYHLTLRPTYEAILPYLHQAYVHGHYVVWHIILPHIRSAQNSIWTFTTRTVWPQLRVLYGDNVEPQLVRIRERLGRHRDQQKVEAVVGSASLETSPAKETIETKTASETVQIQTETKSAASQAPSGSGWDILNDLWPSDPPSTETVNVESQTPTQPEEPKLTGAELKEKLKNDLREWQTKFAVAADKGAEDLEQRVAEITKRQVEHGVKGHGTALLIQLEETANATVEDFKKIIKQTVKAISEDASETELEDAYEKCIAKTRELGLRVKDKAQAVRNWKSKYNAETDALVRAAVRSTMEVLERIHALGLQEVGMRWAWTDGVTYKDWQNYHKLRNTLTEWQAEVEAVGSRHEGLKDAHEAANELEDQAMNTASKMVAELVRLKEVSRWKIWAGDATDDFSNRVVPARVAKASKSIVSGVENLASKASSEVIGTETPKSESIASAVKEGIAAASSQAASGAGSASASVRSAASTAAEKLEEVSSKGFSVVDAATSSGSSAASVASEKAEQAASRASEAIAGSPSDASSAASGAKETIKSKVQKGTEAIRDKVTFASPAPERQKVLGGAMAQAVGEAREIIFDDEGSDSYSRKLQDIVDQAGDRAAALSSVVSEALLGPTKTQGSVESVSSLANEQYQSAIAAASRVLYGTEQQPVESLTSVASEKFAAAVTAASYAIYGTPTPTAIIETIHYQASSRYNQAVSLANEQYENAKSQLSVLVSGTPKPAHETMLSLIEKAYSDSLEAASDRLRLALQYTGSVKTYASPTQGYFESASSIASSKLSEGLSLASSQFRSQPTPLAEGARRQYYEAVGLAHARYQEFLDSVSTAIYGPEQGTVQSVASKVSESAQSVASRASEAAESIASQVSSSVIGTETPWTESVASQASANWEALISRASTRVYGQPTPWAQSIYSQAGEYGAQATAHVAEQYLAVQALVSELVIGKEPDFTESVMNRLSSAYYTGLPAAASSVSSFASVNMEAASSLAGESYEHATSVAAEAYQSASSVVSSIFTPPPAIETIMSQASEQLNAAVESASIAIYGTPKGKVEQASESIASAYSSVQSKASEAIYGTQQAQDSFSAVAASAQAAISEAIFGTPTQTGFIASATDGAGSVYSSITSVVGDKAAEAAAAVSSMIYGSQQGAVESASSRLAAAVEAANSRISEMYANAASSAAEAASTVASVATQATRSVKDEL